MKRVLLITSSFPYCPGEQFLETEVRFYDDSLPLTVLPRSNSGSKREVEGNVVLDDSLLKIKNTKLTRIFLLIRCFFDIFFYDRLFREVLINPLRLRCFVYSFVKYKFYCEFFRKYFSKQVDLDNLIIYTYWHDETTYALQALKNEFGYKLVSRIHRGDLYENETKYKYFPLKRFFKKNIDYIFTITESANYYISDQYGYDLSKVKLARLGVLDRGIVTRPAKENELKIVSCSYVGSVKRIDRIVSAIKVFSRENIGIRINWVHIGSGPEFDKIVDFANSHLSDEINVTFSFLGNLDNNKIFEFYDRNEIDVFVNVSSSEGVPVSIMEAMSCHIPVIAPDVGGVSDMIKNNESGILLSSRCEVEDLVEAFRNLKFYKQNSVREESFKIFRSRYFADNNYSSFVSLLQKL
jgi:glycosyltransferase involved in cell wall biosynthesis